MTLGSLLKRRYRKEYGWVTGVELKSEKVLSAGLNEGDLEIINDAVKYHLTATQNPVNSDASIIGLSHFSGVINALHSQGRYDLSRLIYSEIEEQLMN